VAGLERIDADKWAASVRAGIGADDAKGCLALPLLITGELRRRRFSRRRR
jgi:hypothetical protein